MIRYKDFLLEVLTPEQKKEVDKWQKKPHHSFSDHMFGGDPNAMRATFDLQDPQSSGMRKDIEKYLEEQGIKITDYVKGEAVDKHGRPRGIGSLLVKAPNDLKDDFDNDPSRQQQAGEGEHKVIISRDPYDVAGMTSKGQSWVNQSCMNFSSGSNRHYLPKDLEHGTHVAYLVNKDDTNIERPLARIALKPFIETETGEKILRPEGRTYGDASDKFSHTVSRAMEKYFPGTGFIYKKHPEVYNDDHNTGVVVDVEKALASDDNDIRKKGAKSPYATQDQLRRFYNQADNSYGTDDVRREAIKNENFPHDMMRTIADTHLKEKLGTTDYRKSALEATAVARNIRAPKDILKDLYYNSKDPDVIEHSLQNPRAPREIVDHAFTRGNLRGVAVQSKKLSKQNLETFISNAANEDAGHVLSAIRNNPKINANHLTRILDGLDSHPDHPARSSITEVIAEHSKANEGVINKIIEGANKHPSFYYASSVFDRILQNPKTTKTNLLNMMESPHTSSILDHKILDHPSTDSDVIDSALNSANSREVRAAAANHPKASHANLMKAISDPNINVVRSAFDNPNIDESHITVGMRLGGERAAYALSNEKATEKHIDDALSGKYPDDVAEIAATHPNATPANLDKALQHRHFTVRAEAAGNPKLNAQQIDKILSDHDQFKSEESLSHIGRVLANPNITSDQIHKVLNIWNNSDSDTQEDRSPWLKRILKNPSTDESHLSWMVDNQAHPLVSQQVPIQDIVKHPNFKGKVLDDLVEKIHNPTVEEHYDPNIIHHMVRNDNFTTEHGDKLATSKSYAVREAIADAKITKLSSQARMKLLDDKDPDVRRAAISHMQAGPEHIAKVLNDHETTDDVTFKTAVDHSNFNEDHIGQIIDHKTPLSEQKHQQFLKSVHRLARNGQISPNTINKFISSPSADYRRQLIYLSELTRNPLNADQISKLINDKDEGIKRYVVNGNNVHLNSDHLNSLIDNPSGLTDEDKEFLMRKPDINDSHIEKAINTGDPSFLRGLAINPKLQSNHIHKILDKYPVFGVSLVKHKNFDGTHISKMFDIHDAAKTEDEKTVAKLGINQAIKRSPEKITSEDYTRAMNMGDERIAHTAIQTNQDIAGGFAGANYTNFSAEHLRDAAKNFPNSRPIHQAIARNAALPKDMADDIMKSTHPDKFIDKGRKLAFLDGQSSKVVTPEHISMALQSNDVEVRAAAASRRDLSDEHITKIIDDPEDEVTSSIKYGSFGEMSRDHITQLITKKPHLVNSLVRDNNPNINREHLSLMLDHIDNKSTPNADRTDLADKYHNIVTNYSPNSLSGGEWLTKALNSSHHVVRLAAAYHAKNFTPEQTEKALHDVDSDVRRRTLENSPHVTEQHISDVLKDNVNKLSNEAIAAISHRSATEKNYSDAMDSPHLASPMFNQNLSDILANSYKTTSQAVLSKALDHPDLNVAYAASKNDNLSAENIHKMLDHKNFNIRQEALYKPNLNSSHVDKLLDKDDDELLPALLNRRGGMDVSVKPEHIIRALDSKHKTVIDAALAHPNAPSNIKEIAKNHKNPLVKQHIREDIQRTIKMKKLHESAGNAMRDLERYQTTIRAQIAARRLAAREALMAKKLAASQMLQQQRMYIDPNAVIAEGKAGKFADVIIEKARKQMKVVKVNTKPELNLDIKTGATPEQIGSDQAAENSEEPNIKTGL